MSSTRTLLIAGAIVVVVAASSHFLVRDRPVEATSAAAAAASPADSLPSPAAPAAQPRQLPLPVAPHDPFEDDHDRLIHQIEAQAMATQQQMETLWTVDPIGDVSALVTEDQLASKISEPRLLEVRGGPDEVLDISCRTRLCRIESIFPAGASGNEWGTRMLMEMGGTFGAVEMVSQPTPDGRSRLVVYAFRSGMEPRR